MYTLPVSTAYILCKRGQENNWNKAAVCKHWCPEHRELWGPARAWLLPGTDLTEQ